MRRIRLKVSLLNCLTSSIRWKATTSFFQLMRVDASRAIWVPNVMKDWLNKTIIDDQIIVKLNCFLSSSEFSEETQIKVKCIEFAVIAKLRINSTIPNKVVNQYQPVFGEDDKYFLLLDCGQSSGMPRQRIQYKIGAQLQLKLIFFVVSISSEFTTATTRVGILVMYTSLFLNHLA